MPLASKWQSQKRGKQIGRGEPRGANLADEFPLSDTTFFPFHASDRWLFSLGCAPRLSEASLVASVTPICLLAPRTLRYALPSAPRERNERLSGCLPGSRCCLLRSEHSLLSSVLAKLEETPRGTPFFSYNITSSIMTLAHRHASLYFSTLFFFAGPRYHEICPIWD
jgi:hypothetical protein